MARPPRQGTGRRVDRTGISADVAGCAADRFGGAALSFVALCPPAHGIIEGEQVIARRAE
jgi:hypothetical protein